MTFSLKTDQSQNLFVRQPFSYGSLRLLYQRCRESELQSSPCQDYAEIAGNADDTTVCLSVCDGVGGSYQGDYAARYLGDAMVGWLAQMPLGHQDNHALANALVNQMAQWSQDSHADLNRMEVASSTPALVREVLEETRSGYGSETVFLSCRIDLLHTEQQGDQKVQPANMLMCWMGNVSAQIFTAPDTFTAFNLPGDDRNRWSTARGLRGSVAVRFLHVKDLHRLIIYTDGLADVGEHIWRMDDTELCDHARNTLAMPSNDDMTVLDIQLMRR
jgi:serine/threonine protein phosphatase PrpC